MRNSKLQKENGSGNGTEDKGRKCFKKESIVLENEG